MGAEQQTGKPDSPTSRDFTEPSNGKDQPASARDDSAETRAGVHPHDAKYICHHQAPIRFDRNSYGIGKAYNGLEFHPLLERRDLYPDDPFGVTASLHEKAGEPLVIGHLGPRGP
jgi:hypothetical protein